MRVLDLGDIIDIRKYRSDESVSRSNAMIEEYDWDDPIAPQNRNLSFQVWHRLQRFLTFLFSFFKRRK